MAFTEAPCQEAPDFVMVPIAASHDGSAKAQIIGGSRSDAAEWPATLVFRGVGATPCTSTIVGDRVILTAAHCVADGARGIVELRGRSIAVACNQHPDYRTVSVEIPGWETMAIPDFSLCAADSSLNGVPFERVNRDESLPTLDSTVRLLGFGCNAVGGSDGGFGALYEGDAFVSARPSGQSYFTRTRGGAAVCFGDSGGGAYHRFGAAGGSRTIVGVNSRGNQATLSWLATTGLGGFVSWAESWAAQRQVKICGIHNEATGCR